MSAKRIAAGVLLAAWVLVPGSLRADVLGIVNGSFETGTNGDGSITPGFAGWTDDGVSNGFWLVTDTLFTSLVDPYEPSDGALFLYANRLAGQPQPDGQPTQPVDSTLSQTINLSPANLALVQAGTAEISLSFYYYDTDGNDEGTIALTFLDGTNELGSITTGVLAQYPSDTPYDPVTAPWMLGTLSGAIHSNTTAVRLDVSTHRIDGTATNLSFDDFVGSIFETPLELISRSPAPDAVFTTDDFPIALGGVLVDGASTVDTGSIELILDSTNNLTLAPGDVVRTATTTTVSHAVSSLDIGAHWVSLVYTGIMPAFGPVTSTWSFAVNPAQGTDSNQLYIVNGNFEIGTDGDGSITPGIFGWADDGVSDGFWVVADNDPGSAPDPTEPADGLLFLYANRLAGGQGSQPAASTLSQTIALTPENLALLQAGPTTLLLDFFYFDSDMNDAATVTLTFLDGTNELSSVTTGVLDDYVNGTVYDPTIAPWIAASLSGTSHPDTTAVRLDILSERIGGGSANNLAFDHFVGSILEEPLVVLSESPAPGTLLELGDFPVGLGAVVVDGTSTMDTNSIALILDGTNSLPLAPGDIVRTATTTTVNHVVASLEAGEHSLSLVYSGLSPASGPFTNTWTFRVLPDWPGKRVYVDADTTNTLAWSGGAYGTFNPDGVGSNWTTRTVFGNGGQVYQSQYEVDSPRLNTTVSSLADGTYDVYAYMWVEGQAWRMAASLADTSGIPVYGVTNYPADTDLYVHYQDAAGADPWGVFTWLPAAYSSTNLVSNPFGTNDVMLAEGNRRLMEIYLGQISGTEISVYVDDDPAATNQAARTWYDGIGYERIDGATLDPEIQSATVAGSTVSLEWTSETSATYSIMFKTKITDAVWNPLKTGIAGGDPTTSDSVDVGGTSQGFLRIEGM